ncbi:glutamate-rich WD repeat-containing protein 1-like [Liolophura sinensis]|uniref:glutamate-rich WD repeat-containing protein 1-like n=1 Tax=Liolophura sinensis TaxID=3198878 RepID=UPI003157F8E4
MADEANMEDSSEDEYMDGVESDSDTGSEEEQKIPKKDVYLPGKPIEEGEELVCDESAYVMFHQAQTGAPCLSFDVLMDGLGDKRESYPLTCFVVAGTQAESSLLNHIIVMKMSNLNKTKAGGDEDEEGEESDEDEDEKPELETAMIKHTGSVNRIRASAYGDVHLAASWSENGKVYLWDLKRPLNAVNDSTVMAVYTRNEESPAPIFTFPGHQVEGFAIDWSKTTPGRLATGDCKKNIHLWSPEEGGCWKVDQRPYTGHSASVEDIQWSPVEDNVFASCSVDRSIRVWDARATPDKACMLTAADSHASDVNVISWNAHEPFIVSGGDDGVIKIWDLRKFQEETAVAVFKHHTAPITSVEWNPADSSVFASSGADDQLSLWDLALERDSDIPKEGAGEPDVPPQLLFIHQGQTDIKELHWHPQLPGVVISTAHSGFNVFRTISV